MSVSQLRLLSTGLRDGARAESLLQSAELADQNQENLLEQLAVAPDPDQALLLLIRLLERDASIGQLVADGQAKPLLRLLGASEALGEFLIRRPEHTDIFRQPNVESTPASGGLVDENGTLQSAALQLRAVLLKLSVQTPMLRSRLPA